ncbi:hypothetical protein E3O21_14480 [Cryobacterium flavum]|uniref:Tn3 transposase DDE domain-containing protein n=1 Tax=Cryobacterium flavum TaxID=1424659 RepID=A0ABY2HYY5_9MICO|nr:hypothetical protein E3O21_14480 [Cryobacterium flavum]
MLHARFVDAQSRVPLAKARGTGDVASADGLRFVVPVRTLNAGSNPRYFGAGRGITSSTSSPNNLPASTPSSSPVRPATGSTSSTVSSSSKQRSNPPS